MTAAQLMRMGSSLSVLAQGFRTVLLLGGVVLVAVAAVDWAVRTRRLNPFGGVARFTRSRVDPRLAGVERLVLRAGGHQSATPWWGVVAYVVLALLLLALVDFALSLFADVGFAMHSGVLGIVWLVVHWGFGFLIVALMVRVLSSWIPALSWSRWTRWSHGATDWILRPIRGVLPTFGPVDISPLVAYFGLTFVRWLVETPLLGAIR